jgi:hypothetical protein
MDVTVNNQCLDIELVSPVYFCSRGTYKEYPVKRTDTGIVMKVSFGSNPGRDESGGILMYEVQKRESIRLARQSSVSTIYAKVIKEASKRIRLLVAWKMKRSGQLKISIMLIEYDNVHTLNEDKLAQLYDKVNDIFSEHRRSSKHTCLIYDNTALNIAYEIVRKEGLELKITVSEGLVDQGIIRPIWIESER